jgi:cytochrome P450
LLKGYVNTLVEKLKEKAATNELFDIVPWYNFTTFDIMADLTFGESLQMLQKSDYSPWVKGIFSAVKFITVTSVLRRWQVLNMLSQRAVPKKMIDERKRHLDFAKNSVDKRLALKTDRPDIWTYILRHSGKEDQSLFPTEMYSNGALFMLAGTETTATQLSGMTYFLLKNPEKMERVKKEVREAFSSFEDIEMVKLQQLGYLNACMDETLRLYPPVVVNLPRLVPKGGSLVNGHWMPEGVSLHRTFSWIGSW